MGLDYALRLASMGAAVAVSDINLDSAKEYDFESSRLIDGSLQATLGQFGTQVLTRKVDSTAPVELRQFADDVLSELGRVDVLVCNAGGGGDIDGSLPSELVPDRILATFERNLFSTMYTVAAFADAFKRQGSGKVITVASYAGTTTLPGAKASDYATAKAGVAHYTRYLAQELAPQGITVNALAPGYIATGQWLARFGKDDPESLQQWEQMVPMGRLGTAGDCADVVQFLASSMSNYVTGQVLAVDGGLSRCPN